MLAAWFRCCCRCQCRWTSAFALLLSLSFWSSFSIWLSLSLSLALALTKRTLEDANPVNSVQLFQQKMEPSTGHRAPSTGTGHQANPGKCKPCQSVQLFIQKIVSLRMEAPRATGSYVKSHMEAPYYSEASRSGRLGPLKCDTVVVCALLLFRSLAFWPPRAAQV